MALSQLQASSVPNKTPDLLNKKAFLNDMCPVNVKMADYIKQFMKHIDHYHQDL
jgi:hypothetical protein